ncbi:MAG: DUF3301 domain-containing protein [Gallionellaceae bacterium]|nr:DUF3301 domain-containing protein [Gallionellaceae bacterium]
MSWELVLAAVLVALGWFWWEGLNKRELAIRAARSVCQRAGVQLLDETVALKHLGLERDDNQQVRFRREFFFEYSDTGNNRLPGYVYLRGNRILSANLILPATMEVPDEPA